MLCSRNVKSPADAANVAANRGQRTFSLTRENALTIDWLAQLIETENHMARLPRITVPAYPHHIIQRGNNRVATFFAVDDYHFYLECLGQAKIKCQCRIYAYVLMTNHVHLLVEPAEDGDLGRFMQSVGRRYVRYVNETYGCTGTLWEGRFKSAAVSRDEYLIACSRYIEFNPVRAGIVAHPKDYRWSSYHRRVLGSTDRLLDEDPWYKGLRTSACGAAGKLPKMDRVAD
jgi:putative transposase